MGSSKPKRKFDSKTVKNGLDVPNVKSLLIIKTPEYNEYIPKLHERKYILPIIKPR